MGRRPPRPEAAAAIVRRSWMEALSDGNFWDIAAKKTETNPNVLILVDLAGTSRGDPNVPAPSAVEALIDFIHDRLQARVDLASSADQSQLYAGNRDIYALADLLGYRFLTDQGRAYDIVDLGTNLRPGPFPEASCLFGSSLSADWIEAGFKINLAALHADAEEAYAGGLQNLLRILPLADKLLHYKHRRDRGEVIADLLTRCPPDFTVIEAGSTRDESTSGGRFAIASSSPVLADFYAALKAGLDPYASKSFETVAIKHPLPRGYRLDGSLEPCPVFPLVSPLAQRCAITRQNSEAGDRLVSGWLAQLDPDLFPMERALDTKAQEILTQLVGDGSSPSGNAFLNGVNLAIGFGGHLARSWRTLYAKDTLRRRGVSLGIEPSAIDDGAFSELVEEIDAFRPIIDGTPEAAPGLRWRKLENAVLFGYSYWTRIPFSAFVGKVDVSRTIGYMNDYLGGTVTVLATDQRGRPIRQAERNLYLPQPNYIVLYGGKPIDVTKIETVHYRPGDHRLYWKTVLSTNGSATADDGMASFQRDGEGTKITFLGKQRFTLPPFFRVFDLSLVQDLEKALTTDAYRRFFERTCSNLEALVEGRNIQIGRAPEDDQGYPSAHLEAWLASAAERVAGWFDPANSQETVSGPDERGFVHVVPLQ